MRNSILFTVIALLVTAPVWAQDPASIGSISYNNTLGAYEINSADNLRDLAVYVNGSGDYSTGGSETTAHNCAGQTFKMTADITLETTTSWNDNNSSESNFPSIGWSYSQRFGGTFDGQGHTVSGIRIYRSNEDYTGLFGCVQIGGTVTRVTLADAHIVGKSDVGGIVGYNFQGTISNCHTSSTVAIHAVTTNSHSYGGITGRNYGTVDSCTSSVIITLANGLSGCSSFGGIAGLIGGGNTISNCVAAAVIIPYVTNSGAIVGSNTSGNGILTNNTYHSSLVGNYAFNIGAGDGDVANGATLDTKKLHLYTDRDNTGILNAYGATYNSNSSTAHGAAHPNLVVSVTLKGYTFHKDGTWNTLAVPFNYTNLNYASSPLRYATVKELDTENTSYNSETGALNVVFKTVSSLSYRKPYIVKWDSGDDVSDPVFGSISASHVYSGIGTTNDAPVRIQGSSAPFNLAGGVLLDANNADNRGCHAAITLSSPGGTGFRGWNTAPDGSGTYVTSTIPFGADGSFTLYAQYYPANMNLPAVSATIFGESKYVTTFYNGVLDYQLPEGAKAYTASLDGATVIFHLIGDDGSVIPHGTAAIVVADAASIALNSLPSTTVAAFAGSVLQGSDFDVTVTAGKVEGKIPYVLNISGGVLGFYKFTGATIPAGKAYYLKSE